MKTAEEWMDDLWEANSFESKKAVLLAIRREALEEAARIANDPPSQNRSVASAIRALIGP